MPTSYRDIVATSHLRSDYGRKKRGMYDQDVRYVSGDSASLSSTTARKFSTSEGTTTFVFNDDGTFSLAEADET